MLFDGELQDLGIDFGVEDGPDDRIGALRRAVDLLSQSNHILKSALDGLHDGVFIVNAKGDIVYFNRALTRLTGYTRENTLGKNVFEGLASGLYKNSCVAQVLKTKKPNATINQYSLWGLKKGRRKGYDTLVSGTPIFNSQGEIIYAVSVARDITELQRIRDELEKTKNLSKIYNRQLKSYLQRGSSHIADPRGSRMEKMYDNAAAVADLDLPVLITGETGVGKDFFANYIHNIGSRSAAPFLKINCSAIPENLLESELFGYVPGAFTGASKEGKQGLFEVAGGGTLFLDEIGDMSYPLQAKLLGAIQDREFLPLGGKKPVRVESRIIAATNADLDELIRQKRFRLDLYYRLNVIQFKMPPLRERGDDIVVLVNLFLNNFNNKYNKNRYFSSGAFDRFLAYSWPGNIRELRNTVERLVITAKNECIDENQLLDVLRPTEPHRGEPGVGAAANYESGPDRTNGIGGTLKEAVRAFEAELIDRAISACGSTTEAAGRLGIDVSTLLRKKRRAGK